MIAMRVAGKIREPYGRYLRLLGLTERPSGMAGLREIVRRHVCRVPFENVSKLLLAGEEKKGRLTTLAEFLDGIEQRDLGGTCYTSNPFLARLLRALGYDVDLFGADMNNPNVHTSLRVRIENAAYHVDVGYGGPFREPIPLARLPYETSQGALRYVFSPAGCSGVHEMSVISGGRRVHGYLVHGPPRSLSFFRKTILESYNPGMTFMSRLRIVRYFERDAAELNNRTLILHKNDETTQVELNNLAELRDAVDNHLKMPRCPIEKAVGILEHLTGERFFGN